MYKLSLLKEDVVLIDQNQNTNTVEEINEILKNGSEKQKERTLSQKWYIAEKDSWGPDVHRMIYGYLEDSTASEYISYFAHNVYSSITEEELNQIKVIMKNAIERNGQETSYFVKGERVSIEN